MSGFIFPFANVQDLNDIFNDEKLPYHYFNSLTALPIHNEIVTNHNPVDNIDDLLRNTNEVKCKYFQANEFISLPSRSETFSLLSCNINSASKNFDNFVIQTSLDFCPVLLPFVKQSLLPPLNIYFLSMVILVFLTAGGRGGECC